MIIQKYIKRETSLEFPMEKCIRWLMVLEQLDILHLDRAIGSLFRQEAVGGAERGAANVVGALVVGALVATE
jgi:hypothetical protein